MTHKIINTAYTHRKGSRTTDVKLIKLHETDSTWSRTFKFTYETYNAVERFYGELFNGKKFVPVFTMKDLSIVEDSSAYHIPSEYDLKTRIADYTAKGVKFINLLY